MSTKLELFKLALVEMGRRVGLDWETFDDVMAYQASHGIQWYLTKTWTKDEEHDYQDWLKMLLTSKTDWSAYKVRSEVGMFMLSYGWKTTELSRKTGQPTTEEPNS